MTTTSDRLLIAATVLSLGHHVDHVVRGNHTGWPLVEQVTPFTISLLIYPVIALGVLLTVRRGTAHPFWTVLAGAGVVFLAATHLGPTALEPPGDIIGEYSSRLLGLLAFAWLLVLIAVLAVMCVHEGRLWARTRRAVRDGST